MASATLDQVGYEMSQRTRDKQMTDITVIEFQGRNATCRPVVSLLDRGRKDSYNVYFAPALEPSASEIFHQLAAANGKAGPFVFIIDTKQP